VDGFRFSVTPEAAYFIARVVLAHEALQDYVVTVAPHTEAQLLDLVADATTDAVAKAIEKQRAVPLDPISMKFRWVVGASRRIRFPPNDIVVCDGVPCFVPNEMRPILHGRTLTLVDSELRLEPEPPPLTGAGVKS
jgi:hypothetical protein